MTSTMKLCQDCRHYSGNYICGKPARRRVDPLQADVHYEFESIIIMRQPGGLCGSKAKLWGRKYETVTWRKILSGFLVCVGGIFMALAIVSLSVGDVLVGERERLE